MKNKDFTDFLDKQIEEMDKKLQGTEMNLMRLEITFKMSLEGFGVTTGLRETEGFAKIKRVCKKDEEEISESIAEIVQRDIQEMLNNLITYIGDEVVNDYDEDKVEQEMKDMTDKIKERFEGIGVSDE